MEAAALAAMWPAAVVPATSAGRALRSESMQDVQRRPVAGAASLQRALGPVLAAPSAVIATAVAALAAIAAIGKKRLRCKRSPSSNFLARAHRKLAEASSPSPGEVEDSSVEQLEEQLRIAVAMEDYVKAATLRDVIQNVNLDAELAVLCANREFFDAFQTCDLDRMSRIWHQGDHTSCVHPANYPIHGYSAVVESWDRVFKSGNVHDVQCERISVQVRGNMGRVMCAERINNGVTLVATNLFERTSDGWKLWSHQAGKIDPEMQSRVEEEEQSRRLGRKH